MVSWRGNQVSLAGDAEAEALIHTLRGRDYRIGAIVEQEAVGRLATVRLTRGHGARAPVIDLLFASCGVEDFYRLVGSVVRAAYRRSA